MKRKSKTHSSKKRVKHAIVHHTKHVSHKEHHSKEESGTVSYLAVESPLESRKLLLSGAIDATYGLRDFQKYHELKKLKMDRMMQVRNILNQIQKESAKLRAAVPKEKDIEYLQAQVEEKKQEQQVKTPEEHKSRLELEIEELSKRLSALDREI